MKGVTLIGLSVDVLSAYIVLGIEDDSKANSNPHLTVCMGAYQAT